MSDAKSVSDRIEQLSAEEQLKAAVPHTPEKLADLAARTRKLLAGAGIGESEFAAKAATLDHPPITLKLTHREGHWIIIPIAMGGQIGPEFPLAPDLTPEQLVDITKGYGTNIKAILDKMIADSGGVGTVELRVIIEGFPEA